MSEERKRNSNFKENNAIFLKKVVTTLSENIIGSVIWKFSVSP
jgi:hypothetical protein